MVEYHNIETKSMVIVQLHTKTSPRRYIFNTLRPRQNGRRFPDDIFKCNFLNEDVWVSNKISLKFVPKGPINNIPSLVQIMAWRRSGDKPLSEPMMVSLLTHICVTRPQWVKCLKCYWNLADISAGLLPKYPTSTEVLINLVMVYHTKPIANCWITSETILI